MKHGFIEFPVLLLQIPPNRKRKVRRVKKKGGKGKGGKKGC